MNRFRYGAALYLIMVAALAPTQAMADTSNRATVRTASSQVISGGPVAPAFPTSSTPLAFSGLTLQQAMEDAVARSPDVETARARADAAAADLAAARAGIGPSLVAGYALNPQAGPVLPSTVTQTAFNLGVQATLLSFAQYLPMLDSAEATHHVANAQRTIAERNERIRAAGLYFDALKARATLQTRRDALSLANQQVQAAQRRFRAGDAPRIDVVRAEVAAAQALAALENAQAADANASDALQSQTGVEAIGEPVAGLTPPLTTAAATVDSAVQRALASRAEMTSAQQNIGVATAGVHAARAAALPAITVSAGYETGTDTGQPVKGPTINASFELPFNGSQATRVSDANAALAAAQAQNTATQRALTLEVRSAVRNLNAAVLATAASTKARLAAQEELNATMIGYATGATSSLERTAASATYADARLSELTAVYDEAQARAVLDLELGP